MSLVLRSDETIITPPPGTPVADGNPLYADEFTGNATSLLGRQTDSGPDLSQTTWLGDDAVLAASGGRMVRGSNVTGNWAQQIQVPGTDIEFEVHVIKRPTAGGIYIDVLRQAVAGSPNGYRIELTATNCRLVKRVSGAQINLTGSLPFVDGQKVKVRVRRTPAGGAKQVDVLLNGAVVASVEDSSIMTAGYCGFSGLPATTGFSVESVKVNTFG